MQRRLLRRIGGWRNIGARNGIELVMQHAPAPQAIDIGCIEGDEFLGTELARQAQTGHSMISEAALKGELYGRLAKAFVLPLLALLGVPLGLAAKRSGRAPGMVVGGVLLLAFFHAVQLGQGLAATGRLSPEIAVGGPFFAMAAIAFTVFLTSLKRPGETPVGRAMEGISAVIGRFKLKRAGSPA